MNSSSDYCYRAAKRANSSFPAAFRVLPSAKRDATIALYAFFRATDDLADGPGDPAGKRAAVRCWRQRLDDALAGRYSHRTHAAVHHVVKTFGVDPSYLHAVIDGTESDLDPVCVATFADLERYCFQVASAVGLACLPVWGYRDGAAAERARVPAEAAGVAFQLTNILRDLGEDLADGRVYLPRDECERFGCPPEAWRDPASSDAFRSLMRFQTARARTYYDCSRPLADFLSADGRAVFLLISGLYRRLLDEIEARDFDVFTRRVRVGTATKLRLLAAAWPTKWGLR